MAFGRENGRTKFDGIVTPHMADAFALALWLSGNRTDAQDIVQEACLRAFRAIDSYHGGSSRAWVLTIVRRTAYTWLSRNRIPGLIAMADLSDADLRLADQGGDGGSPNKVTPEAELIRKTDKARLEAAITALPIQFRETFVLRDVQGLEYREIAEVTGMPLGTVMSRLARARRHLIATIGSD